MGGVISLVIGSVLAFINTPESLTMNNPHVEMSIGSIGHPLLFFITPVMIVLGLVYVSSLYQGVIPNFIKYIGQHTLIVLCCHEALIYMISLVARFLHLDTISVFPFLCSIIIVLTIKPIVFLFEKFFPNAIGRES